MARPPRWPFTAREVATLENSIDMLNVAGLVLGLLAGLAGVALFTSGISRRVALNAVNAKLAGGGKAPRPGCPLG